MRNAFLYQKLCELLTHLRLLIRRASAEQIEAMRARGESRSDWRAADAMARADIERLADEEDGALPAGWESTVDVGLPEQRQPIHIRLDPEVLRWFKAHGPGYRTRINAVLRAFVRTRQRAERTRPACCALGAT